MIASSFLLGRLTPKLKLILRDIPPKGDENPAFCAKDSKSLYIAKEIVLQINGDCLALSLRNIDWILPWLRSNNTIDNTVKVNIDKLSSRLYIIPFNEIGRWFYRYLLEPV